MMTLKVTPARTHTIESNFGLTSDSSTSDQSDEEQNSIIVCDQLTIDIAAEQRQANTQVGSCVETLPWDLQASGY